VGCARDEMSQVRPRMLIQMDKYVKSNEQQTEVDLVPSHELAPCGRANLSEPVEHRTLWRGSGMKRVCVG
jgi:hypothetical protein